MALPKTVFIQVNEKYVSVDGRTIRNLDISIDLVKSNLPDGVESQSVRSLTWKPEDPQNTCIGMDNGGGVRFEPTEENYNKLIKPFVDVWQIEADKEDQEQEEAEAEWNKFENRKARALTQLNEDFETAKQRAHIKSSLGFTIDANQTANENITGLLVTIGETETIQFCDYYNKFRELNKSQLQILQTELITNAQSLYQQKWQYRHAIEDCIDNEGLDAVLATIEFTYMDFTPTGEGETETGEQV